MASPKLPLIPSLSSNSSSASSEPRDLYASSDLSTSPETRNLLITLTDPQERNPVSPLAQAPQEAARRAYRGFSPPGLDLSLALDPHLEPEPQEAGGRAYNLGVDLTLSLAPPGLNLPRAPEPQGAGGRAYPGVDLKLSLAPPGMDLNLSQGGLPLTVNADVVYPETSESVNNY